MSRRDALIVGFPQIFGHRRHLVEFPRVIWELLTVLCFSRINKVAHAWDCPALPATMFSHASHAGTDGQTDRRQENPLRIL